MRILGLDYGVKTVGVAVSDPLGLTAQGVEIIRRQRENKLRQTLARIEELARQYQAERVVLGFPKHMNNDVGERAEKTLEFRGMLEQRLHLPVDMEDERLTTVEAVRAMNEMNLRGKERKAVVDEIAAVFILQTYLDRMQLKKSGGPETGGKQTDGYDTV